MNQILRWTVPHTWRKSEHKVPVFSHHSVARLPIRRATGTKQRTTKNVFATAALCRLQEAMLPTHVWVVLGARLDWKWHCTTKIAPVLVTLRCRVELISEKLGCWLVWSIGAGQNCTGVRPWCPHSELMNEWDSFIEVYHRAASLTWECGAARQVNHYSVR